MSLFFSPAAALLLAAFAHAQIDPQKRQLIQIGYDQPFRGKGPIAGYLFYYRNQPQFPTKNTTLRLALAPVYVDAELGFKNLIGRHTDFGIGVGGGGFADSYTEIRRGQVIDDESFTGHGGDVAMGVYHRVNPNQRVPLSINFKLGAHATDFRGDPNTSAGFRVPPDQLTYDSRVGFRLGGVEPVVFPRLAMEISAWQQTFYRTKPGYYGFNNDRYLNSESRLFWSRALLAMPFPKRPSHYARLSVTAGTSQDADRLSAFRLGGMLPLMSEFPLSLPGYFYQEVSADRFVLGEGLYSYSIDRNRQWDWTMFGSYGKARELAGTDAGGGTHSGVGGGLTYKSPRRAWKIVAVYTYAFEAVRSDRNGAHGAGLMVQYDLEVQEKVYAPGISPNKSRGLDRIIRR